MADKIKIDIAASYDDKDAKKALKDAEAIDKLKPEIEITADDKASGDLKAVQDQAEQLSRADAEILVRALIDTAESDLKELRRQLDDIDGSTATVKIDSSSAKRGLDDVTKSAGSSKSVLANMVGNTTQDLGALGGVAGSTGVAIGQMGEYMADARAEGESFSSIFKNFGAVAGPILGVSVALAAVNDIMSSMAKGQAVTKAFDTKQVEQFSAAIEKGGDVVDNYNDKIEETGEVLAETGLKAGPAWASIVPGVSDLTRSLGLMGRFGTTIENILPTLNKAGISAETWTKIITSSEPVDAMDTLRAALDAVNISDNERTDILVGARAAQDNYNTSVKNGAEIEKFFGDNAERTRTSLEAGRQAGVDYIHFLQDRHAAAADEIADYESNRRGAENHTNAIARLNVEAERVDRARILAKERNAVDDVTDAYRDMHDELSDRKSLLTLQQDFDDVRAKAEAAWTASTKGAEESEAAQRDFQISQIDTINNALEYIATIEGIPDKAVTDIQALIDQGAYSEALNALETLSRPRSVEFVAHLNELSIRAQLRALGIAQSAAGSGNFRGGPTVVGEDGPEIVNLPAGSQIIPANVSSAMMHNGYGNSAPMVVNVNMPKGSRGVDVLRQVSSQARRSGRRYGVPVVHYARR